MTFPQMPETSRIYSPTFQSTSTNQDVSLDEHSVKMTMTLDYRLDSAPKTDDLLIRKYYITYSIGGTIEGKVISLAYFADRKPDYGSAAMGDPSRSGGQSGF